MPAPALCGAPTERTAGPQLLWEATSRDNVTMRAPRSATLRGGKLLLALWQWTLIAAARHAL